MSETYDHLPLLRLDPVNPRRTRTAFRPIVPPADPQRHAISILDQINQTVEDIEAQEPGFDPRLLLKIEADKLEPEDLESIEGIEVISQEGREILVLFASAEGLNEFQNRLRQISRGETPTRKEIFYAIKGVEGWKPDDRLGPTLLREGIPEQDSFVVDVELWPLIRGPIRNQMLDHFESWIQNVGIEKIDRVNQETIILYRLRVSPESFERLRYFRDVRVIDLPPRYQLSVNIMHTSVGSLTPPPMPSENAPCIAILDSGLATNHPLLSPAIGDAQSFISGLGPEDDSGHGTMVAGLALYGDVEECLRNNSFIPSLRILSGRIFDEKNENPTGFVENQITDAVEYFVRHYNCRIFNLSFGDATKPYRGGHVRGLAAVLDSLAKQYGVLFIVPTGNYGGFESPTDLREQYPEYLFDDEAQIIDPAPALNVLTVGSLAKQEICRMGQRFPNDPGYQPVARKDQPSPFTRSGPGPRGAIKPEVVEYGGNISIDLRANRVAAPNDLLGEASTGHDFVGGRPFAVDRGTSYAAPRIAHLAGQLLKRYPKLSSDAIRALIVAHSRCPDATRQLFENDESKIFRIVGYGKPEPSAVLDSIESRVTMINEEIIEGETHHFYQIFLPDDFFGGPARRPRRITVALAHTPMVRRTRINYKASRLEFRVVKSSSLEDVIRVFRHTRPEDREKIIPEAGNFRPTGTLRGKGTVQAATWELRQVDRRWDGQSLYVVVTRTVEPWARTVFDRESYALVVVVEDKSEQQVRYYTQIMEQIQQVVRERVRI